MEGGLVESTKTQQARGNTARGSGVALQSEGTAFTITRYVFDEELEEWSWISAKTSNDKETEMLITTT